MSLQVMSNCFSTKSLPSKVTCFLQENGDGSFSSRPSHRYHRPTLLRENLKERNRLVCNSTEGDDVNGRLSTKVPVKVPPSCELF